MSYIIVLPEGFLTSEVRAKSITRELYNITVPLAVQAEYQKDGTVFGVITHPDGIQHALQVDLSRLVSAFPEVSEYEKAMLEGFIATSEKITFGQIIPSTATVRSYEYMVENGWFPSEV